MLDDDNSIAVVAEAVEHHKELPDVMKMESGGRFIQNIERLSCISF